MRVEKSDNTYFGAFLKFSPSIERIDAYCIPRRIKTSFVQIDCNNNLDIEALSDVAKHWKNNLYADKVYNTAYMKSKNEKDCSKYEIFALTFQKDNFERLNSDQIIGVAEVMPIGDKQILIEHIEGKPEYINEINRHYNKIGTAMLDSLKELYNKIFLVSRKSNKVSDFYVKNGFVESFDGSGLFVWVKDVLSDFTSIFL